jgi:hypothetical protein
MNLDVALLAAPRDQEGNERDQIGKPMTYSGHGDTASPHAVPFSTVRYQVSGFRQVSVSACRIDASSIQAIHDTRLTSYPRPASLDVDLDHA